MKRIVSIAAAILVSLFIVFLGLSSVKKIDNINKNNENKSTGFDAEVVTEEPSIWDQVKNYQNLQKQKESETSLPQTDISDSETVLPENDASSELTDDTTTANKSTKPKSTTAVTTETTPKQEIENNFTIILY